MAGKRAQAAQARRKRRGLRLDVRARRKRGRLRFHVRARVTSCARDGADDGVASDAGRADLADIRRSRRTAIRSLTAISSSSSEDATSNARPSRAKLADQRHDLGVGADIDAARRLVENEMRGPAPAIAPARPSAGCRPRTGRPVCPRRASRSPRASIISSREPLLLAARESAAASRAWSAAQGRCSRAR